MKKNFLWIIPIVLLLIFSIIFFILWVGANKEAAIKTAQAELYEAQRDSCQQGLERPMTMEQRMEIIENKVSTVTIPVSVAPVAKVSNTPSVKKVAARKTTVKSVKKADVAETSFAQTSFTAPAARSEVIVSNDNSVSSTIYDGEIKGDVGTTTNRSRNLVYFIKSSLLTGSVFYVNGDVNKKMTLDKQTGYWYYLDPVILSDNDIANRIVTWNIKGAIINWGGGSYQSWFPHETLKPLISSVRGFEYGMITNDDLNKMSQKDSHIWSETNPNGIYQPLPGINKDRTDQSFYHGWNIRTRISYKKVTQ